MLNTSVLVRSLKLSNIGPDSPWMGDQLGTLAAVGFFILGLVVLLNGTSSPTRRNRKKFNEVQGSHTHSFPTTIIFLLVAVVRF
jgi:hypothetical protein